MRPEWNRHKSLDVLHENCLAPAAYLIPYHSAEASLLPRERSRLFQCLSGRWDFRFYPALYEVEDFVAEPEVRTDWDEIPVPMSWQMLMDRNYDRPFYGDSKYPFHVDPPHVPAENPCGLYRRFFTVDKKALEGEVQLRFDGVDSCFYLYLNGTYVGYSQVSHSSSVFSVTPFLREGENEIRVLVLKWCDGSYLEDQDKIRLSGIFRDVYLLYREKAHLADLYLHPTVSEDLSAAELRTELCLTSPCKIAWSLYSPKGDVVAQGETEGKGENEEFSLSLSSPMLWSDETPHLYRLQLQVGGEYFSQDVGFRRLEIRDNCVLINGKKVKGKGVNRHDSHPETGAAVTVEHMLRDLYILKQNNVNMVRASHYPNDPRFLTFCDRLGFYVCNEADLETHGLDFIEGMGRPYLTDDPRWTEAYVDRAERMLEQDKNHPCVIFWSVGNECGIGQNLEAEAKYLHERMPGCIVHNERFNFIQHRLYIEDPKVNGLERYVQKAYMDIDSRMYATPADCRRYMAEPDRVRPFFLCEYCHAMGNSPGDLKEYWDIIYANDAFFGGCLWEMTDHAVNVGTPEEPKYLYGGDFGDEPNRSNFCADGLVWPDRRLHSGMLEYRQILSPVEALSFDEKTGVLVLKNRRYFTDLSDLALLWRVEEEGRVIASGRVAALSALPQETESLCISLPDLNKGSFVALSLDFVSNTDRPWAETGHLVSTAQFILQEEKAPAEPTPCGKLSFTETEKSYVVCDGETSFTFDKNRGLLISLSDGKGEFLAAPLDFTVYRAPADNDLYVREMWNELGLHRALTSCRSFSVAEQGEGRVVLRAHLIYGAIALAPLADVFVDYSVVSGFGLTVSLRFVQRRKCTLKTLRSEFTLPRIGMQCSLCESLETLSYFGLGPMAAYQDKRLAARMGLYRTTVTEHLERYIKPQENMAHAETRYVLLTDDTGRGLRVSGTKAHPRFSFNASHFTPLDLAATRHDFELSPRRETVLNIDLAQCGIGSNSCGPTLPEHFRLNDMEYRFSFCLAPFERK